MKRTSFTKDRINMYLSGMQDKLFKTSEQVESDSDSMETTEFNNLTEEKQNSEVISQGKGDSNDDLLERIAVKQEDYSFEMEQQESRYEEYYQDNSQDVKREQVKAYDSRFLMDEARTTNENGEVGKIIL